MFFMDVLVVSLDKNYVPHYQINKKNKAKIDTENAQSKWANVIATN